MSSVSSKTFDDFKLRWQKTILHLGTIGSGANEAVDEGRLHLIHILELLEGIIHRLTRSKLAYEIEPPWRVTDALAFSIKGSEFFDAGVDDARCDFGSMAFLVVVSEGFEGDGVLGPIGSGGYDGSIFLHRG